MFHRHSLVKNIFGDIGIIIMKYDYYLTLKDRNIFKVNSNSITNILDLFNNRIVFNSDKDLKIWNTEKNLCEITLSGHTDNIECLILFKDLIVSGSMDKTVRMWNLDKCELVIEDFKEPIRFLKMFNDETLIIGTYNTLTIWNKNILKVIPNVGTLLCNITILSSYTFAFSDYSTGIQIWNIQTNSMKKIIPPLNHPAIYCIANVSNNRIISGHSNGSINFWNIENNECILTIPDLYDNSYIKSLIVLDENIICDTDFESIKIFNLMGENHLTINKQSRKCDYFILPDSRLCLYYRYGSIKIWNLETKRIDIQRYILLNTSDKIISVGTSRNKIVVGTKEGYLIILE